MKRFALFILTLLLIVFVSSCGDSKKADIVTTMFPQYDFAKQIVQDKMTVSLLIPPGAEIHDYEATSKDLVAIKESKLFIFTSLDIDTWISNPNAMGGDQTKILNLSESFTHIEHDHMKRDSHFSLALDDHDDDHDDDIHFWVDPLITIQLIEAILEQIIEIDPEHYLFYQKNANDYIDLLMSLHLEIDLFFDLNQQIDSTIYFAGHNAMSAFASRYHFNIVSLFKDFKPDADLTSAELKLFVDEVRQSNTAYLFVEELVIPKAANKIKDELKIKYSFDLFLLELHGYHNVSKEDLKEQVTYLSLMQRNFENLKIALGHSDI